MKGERMKRNGIRGPQRKRKRDMRRGKETKGGEGTG